jgi:hypothetical protein
MGHSSDRRPLGHKKGARGDCLAQVALDRGERSPVSHSLFDLMAFADCTVGHGLKQLVIDRYSSVKLDADPCF